MSMYEPLIKELRQERENLMTLWEPVRMRQVKPRMRGDNLDENAYCLTG
jgi:hypothetical protein